MLIKNTKAINRFLSLLLVLVLILSTLSSCIFFRKPAGSKEEIIDNIESSTTSRKSVYQYLADWGVPAFDYTKFLYFEDKVNKNYVYNEIPDVKEHARLTAYAFLEYFYDKTDLDDQTDVTDALLTCYVAALGDPYSLYREPVASSDFNTNMSGKFGGIGVMIEYDHTNETLMVSSIFIGSPAEIAGVKVGDYIHAIDGRTVEEIGYLNAVDYVRGEIGTYVELTLLRDGEYVTVSVKRDIVEEINVSYEIDEETNFGYVQIVSFKDNTFAQFKKAIDALEDAGVSGIIFDLRGNPGGYVDSVCDVLSYLLPTGYTVMSYVYKGDSKVERKTRDDGGADHTVNLPMVVICDENTASAGEIFTAAVRDYRNDKLLSATIVGTTTYKKGIMQSGFSYLDGSTVTLTTAFYNPPCGINYHGIGVTPDVYVELPEAELDPETGKYLPVDDTQLEAATEELKKLVNAN